MAQYYDEFVQAVRENLNLCWGGGGAMEVRIVNENFLEQVRAKWKSLKKE